MNKHQEHHHGLHHQEHSEDGPHTEMINPDTDETCSRESELDQLEKAMFERAR